MQPKQMYSIALRIRARSRDDSTKVGCAIFNEQGNFLISRPNAFPNAVSMTPDRVVRPDKYDWVVHAETNAIAAAARRGFCLDEGSIWSTQIPCSTCMGIIIQAGIQLVVCPPFHNLADKWKDNASVSLKMASEAGVRVYYWEEKLETFSHLSR